MSDTKKQKERKRFADMCDKITGNSKSGDGLRKKNRQVDARKRKQFKKDK